MSRVHTTREAVERFRETLSARDRALLDQLRDLKLMSGAQIQAVHFPLSEHATADAAARAWIGRIHLCRGASRPSDS